MAKYDDASWHYGGDFPEDLSTKNGATHIGMFLAWCIDNELVSGDLLDDAAEEIQQVKDKMITGADFLINVCDEKLLDEDLNEIGNEFARDYYEDDSDFGLNYSSYLDDYSEIFDEQAAQNGFEYESFYHIEDTVENYNLLKSLMDIRFNEWKKFRGK